MSEKKFDKNNMTLTDFIKEQQSFLKEFVEKYNEAFQPEISSHVALRSIWLARYILFMSEKTHEGHPDVKNSSGFFELDS